MSDVAVTTESPTSSTPPTPPPLPNEAAARTDTGELKDARPTTTPTTPPEKKEEKPAEEKPAGAPEKYEDFKIPEGRTLDEDTMKEAQGVFKEAGLNQAQAQKLVDLYIKEQAKVEGAPKKEYEAMLSKWTAQVHADKELSTGTELKPEVQQGIGKLKALLPKDVRDGFDQAMNMSGVGSHPSVVKAIYELSKYVTEPSHVPGKGPSPEGQKPPGEPSRPSLAKAMFPNLPG